MNLIIPVPRKLEYISGWGQYIQSYDWEMSYEDDIIIFI